MARAAWTAIFFLCYILHLVNGHGRLIEPPSRASAWRYGFNTPHNYNDHELYCGGFSRQWIKNGGKCGVCGDAWDTKLPRPHEFGGIYGQGVIVRRYNPGGIINIRVELTASHMGYFEFAICPDYKNTTQECLDKNVLRLMRPQDVSDHLGTRYFPMDGNKVYEMKYRLPSMTCSHCVLQWRYIAGNNWGNCPNGTGAVGCGPQEEFRACADIQIGGKEIPAPPETPAYVPTRRPKPTELPTQPEVPTTATVQPTTEKQPTLPTGEPSYSPITAIIISFVSFLVVFLIFLLLYFHYYQVGERIKKWIKDQPREKQKNQFNNKDQTNKDQSTKDQSNKDQFTKDQSNNKHYYNNKDQSYNNSQLNDKSLHNNQTNHWIQSHESRENLREKQANTPKEKTENRLFNNQINLAPLPPPRVKKLKKTDEMQDIELGDESIA